MKRDTVCFIVTIIIWEIAVSVIYALFMGYSSSNTFSNMDTNAFQYTFASQSTTFQYLTGNSTQEPFPHITLLMAIVLLSVGLSLVGAYIQRAGVTNMSFTVILMVLSIQNFFIFRNILDRLSLNNGSTWFNTDRYSRVNLINYENSLQRNQDLPSASFIDAIGAALAMNTAYTAVMGRVGLGHMFVLSFLGTLFYEVNSMILWRLWIPDNGYPSRAFGFGSVLGIISSLILGQKDLTKKSINYVSTYNTRVLPFLGIIIVWCTFPILITSNTFNKSSGQIVAMAGQVNMWLALSSSSIGVYIASIFLYRKFSVFELVFSAISGGIAYSSSSSNNYNPGAALAIGTVVGLICGLFQDAVRQRLNKNGIIDSNSALFSFLLPSFFAAVFSAILVGVGNSSASATVAQGSTLNTTLSYGPNLEPTRSSTSQGGYMIAGWIISVMFGLVAGIIIGIIYRMLDDRQKKQIFFSDLAIYCGNDRKKVVAPPEQREP